MSKKAPPLVVIPRSRQRGIHGFRLTTAGMTAWLFSFCALAPLAWAEHRPSNAAVRAFNEGVKYFNDRRFNEAVPYFDQAISHDSEFAEAYFARGACRHSLKAPDGALMDLNEVLRLKPDYLDARALRGVVHYEADRWDQALEDFDYVLQRRPADAQALLGRAVIKLKREDRVAAERDFRAFLRVRPEDPLAPRVHQLLSSLAPKEPEERPGVRQPSRRASPSAQSLADSLMPYSNPLAESYGRKVLRGERAQAVGDIRSLPSVPVPAGRKAPEADIEIVEPR